jgi:hypothetical protein
MRDSANTLGLVLLLLVAVMYVWTFASVMQDFSWDPQDYQGPYTFSFYDSPKEHLTDALLTGVNIITVTLAGAGCYCLIRSGRPRAERLAEEAKQAGRSKQPDRKQSEHFPSKLDSPE